MSFSDEKKHNQRLAIQFILFFGIISALGDVTYEGARSVYGLFLGTLGASAIIIGLITGFGEFLGYVLRLASGALADRTKAYWAITITGYGLLVSVPLLAIANRWEIAAIFIILERVGKAIRGPPRDAMLSHAAKQIGTGMGFGIHEALDQVGAIAGPLLFTFMLFYTQSYSAGFGVLIVPALLCVLSVLITRSKIPNPMRLETDQQKSEPNERPKESDAVSHGKTLPQAFWLYAAFTFINVLGFASFPLISFHIYNYAILPVEFVPLLYGIAMGVDAIFALIIGRLYDHYGFSTLMLVPLITFLIAMFGFAMNASMLFLAVLLWGVLMAIQETIMRASIADITPMTSRGNAYGIFNTLYGVGLLLSSTLLGFLYEIAAYLILPYVLVIEVIASLFFLLFWRYARQDHRD